MMTAIRVSELRKRFSVHVNVVRKRVALDGLSLEVREGEVFGFLGPNGAGKTTTIKILTALLRADSGHAELFGRPPQDPQARRQLGFLPESPTFYDHLSGREFLQLCGKLCGMHGKELRERVSVQIERVGLAHAADLQIRRYSKGMTQRIGIAQALLHDPKLVILDEPMSGLDPMGRGDVRDIILELRKAGKTVFFSTHIIPDVEAICDRVGIVSKGKMIRVGTVKELLTEGSTDASEVLAEALPDAFSAPYATDSSTAGERRLFAVKDAADLHRLLHDLLAANARIVSVSPRRASLEDTVVRMITQVERPS